MKKAVVNNRIVKIKKIKQYDNNKIECIIVEAYLKSWIGAGVVINKEDIIKPSASINYKGINKEDKENGIKFRYADIILKNFNKYTEIFLESLIKEFAELKIEKAYEVEGDNELYVYFIVDDEDEYDSVKDIFKQWKKRNYIR